MFELSPADHRGHRHVISYNPFNELENWEKEFFGRNSSISEFNTDISDNGDSFLLEADLPGFKKEDIHVNIEGDYVVINAERNSEKEEKDKKGNYIRRERSYGTFMRSFDISNIDSEAISVEYTDGVLKMTLPKKKPTLPASRRLEIK